MREDFVRAEDRRRELLSAGIALAGGLLVFALAFVLGLLRADSLETLPSPVYVSLEEGPTGQSASPAPGRENRATGTPPPGSPAPAPASTPAVPSPANPARPAQASPPAPASPAPARVPIPAAPPSSAAPREYSTSPSPAASGLPNLPSAPLASTGPATPNQVYRTSEKGNSASTTFGAGEGDAGRSMYVPIYLYLPPPQLLPEILPSRIPDLPGIPAAARRADFLRWYGKDAAGWRLKVTVPLDQRDWLWSMLEDAGYEAAKADFKLRPNLRPVTLRFTVTPAGEGSKPRLEGLAVVSSSGYPDIDDAVRFGFERGAYFNRTDKAVTGTFTYTFE